MAVSAALELDQATAESAAEPTERAHGQPARERLLLGIVFILGSTAFFSCADALSKALAASLPAIEVTWFRYVVFSVLMVPLVFWNGGPAILGTRRPGLQVMRGVAMVGSALVFTMSLRFLPLADATAIVFVSPVFITALSIVFLGEVVGWRRWTSAAVGLLGVLVVVRPGTSAFQAAAVFPLVSAMSWAVAVITTRKMSSSEHPVTTLAYSALIGTIVLSTLLPFGWVVPTWREIGIGLALGILSTIGHVLVVLAYRQASASTLAPFSYMQLIGAGIVGFAVFGSVPDRWTLTGAGIIVASGLYTAHRARVRARASSHR